jgi:hypothetical protein
MPHATLKMAPGVDQNRTPALNEAALSDADLIRFMPDRQGLGLVQKLGGWRKFYGSALHTPIRALWAWQDTNSKSHLAVGAETAFKKITKATSNGAQAIMSYDGENIFATGSTIAVRGFIPDGYNGIFTVRRSVPGRVFFDCAETAEATKLGTISTGGALSVITDGSRQFITPTYIESQVKPKVSTVAGSPVVTIEDPVPVVYEGDVVFIKTQISVGGLILFGAYQIVSVDVGQYDIIAKNILGATTPATSNVTSGGVLATYSYTVDSPYVIVTLPDHGLRDGDTYAILDPIEYGNKRLYGNYIVSQINIFDKKNQFNIIANGPTTAASMRGFPARASSANNRAVLDLQNEIGFTLADRVQISGTNPNNDGIFNVVKNSQDSTVTISTNKNWNNMVSLGSIWRADGAFNKIWDVTYTDPYRVNLGDTVDITNVVPASYNGTYVVTKSTDNRFTIQTNGTGDITTPGTVTVTKSVQNTGLAYYVYSRAAASQPVVRGYGVGGYGVGGYGVGDLNPTPKSNPVPIAAQDWTIDNWGENLIVCPVGGAVYEWSPISGAQAASIIQTAPVTNDGMFVAMPQRQIVTWGSTFNGIADPLLIRWSDVSNYNVWVATVTNQAGSFRVSKGSKIVGCLQGPQQALIWTDFGVWSMQYVGPPLAYSFNEIGTGCGLIGRKAAGSINGMIFWMGPTQFFRLGGSGAEPIACPVWDKVFQNIDLNHVDKIRFAANSNFNEVSWFYPTTDSGGEIGGYVKYNIVLNAWDCGSLKRTAWINQSVLGTPIGAGLDGFIYQHEIGNDADRLPMRSYFQTGYFQIAEAEYKIFVDQVWPDFKWGQFDGPPGANLKLTFYVTDYPGETPRVYGPYDMNLRKEFITPRFRGRLVSIKVESDDAASFWRIGATRYRFTNDGKF